VPPTLANLQPSQQEYPVAANAAALSANGSVVVAGVGTLLRVWTFSGRAWYLRYTLQGHIGIIQAVAISMDGTRAFSGACDGTILAW
jgi:hypothetical protein